MERRKERKSKRPYSPQETDTWQRLCWESLVQSYGPGSCHLLGWPSCRVRAKERGEPGAALTSCLGFLICTLPSRTILGVAVTVCVQHWMHKCPQGPPQTQSHNQQSVWAWQSPREAPLVSFQQLYGEGTVHVPIPQMGKLMRGVVMNISQGR